jgi:ubiquinone/menaquinone biosynthesis C-methylase UbiE
VPAALPGELAWPLQWSASVMAPERVCHDFHQISYRHHRDHWQAIIEDKAWRPIIERWFDPTTADYWRHLRMYEAAQHLAESSAEQWLTVGDGQYGLDSVRLRAKGVAKVLPTDIADAALRDAKARGLIDEYRVENAERLSFADSAFDFVFCKESFHHFPRPFLALYEMLRVGRKGVILVEPQDQIRSPLRRAIYYVRRLAGRQKHFDAKRYEDSGNYVYSISEREIEKACLGINIPCVAFKGLTDFYIKGVEFEPASFSSRKFILMRTVVFLHGLLARLRLTDHNVLMCCILKEEPSPRARDLFVRSGWKIVDLPRNPYITEPTS